MTDKEFDAQRRRVERFYKKWSIPTGMSGWIVSHAWYRDGSAGDDDDDQDRATTARTSVAWEYLHVCFHWNLKHIATNSDQELDRIVRHEICHVLVNEMRMWGPSSMSQQQMDEAMKHEERTVTSLASILLWCRESGFKDKTSPRKR